MADKKGCILVVDDSEMIRAQIRGELAQAGYDVIEARNGFEALVKVAEQPCPDLITLDVEMPKMDGFETCQKLRSRPYCRWIEHDGTDCTPIVFITSLAADAERRRAFALGATEFIAKPFAKGAVVAVVNKILSPQVPSDSIAALVVDDNLVSRKVAVSCLKRVGIVVHEAADGQEAYDFIKSDCHPIDIVVTDLIMPNMDGNQLCQHIRQELDLADLPIIVLTAISETSELAALFSSGASDFLVKPFAKEALLARVAVYVERNRLALQLRMTQQELKAAQEKIRLLVSDA